MSFIQTDYLLFFAAVCTVYWLLPSRRLQNGFLLLGSYVFYGWLTPILCLLLFSVTAVNYLAARSIDSRPQTKDLVLGVTVVVSIVNLCFFKYFGWFSADILPKILSTETAAEVQLWNLALPLGLSFYTFHNLAYTIDVYRGSFEVRKDPLDYFLYGSFFPQLVAGPVERASNLLPQLEAPRKFQIAQIASGFELALWGAFKKIALADTIAPYVDLMFQHQSPSWAMVWTGALGFTIQALADFSGYTDIARGSARMLGIELMHNFDHPYMAATPMEFWQRWHMSFSTWLREYVYVPSCFSDWVRRWITIPGTGDWGPFANTSRALFITMMVSGIWHGSTANFLLWGFYYFVIGTVYAWAITKVPKKMKKQGGWRWITVPVMFCFTVLGMHIFRQPSVEQLLKNLQLSPVDGSLDQWIVSSAMLGLCAYAALPLVAALLAERYLLPRLKDTPWWLPVRTTGWAVMAVAVFSSVRTSAADFIYFQF